MSELQIVYKTWNTLHADMARVNRHGEKDFELLTSFTKIMGLPIILSQGRLPIFSDVSTTKVSTDISVAVFRVSWMGKK
jgi:hypothetical protein